MIHYSTQLKAEVRDYSHRISEAEAALVNFRAHLVSSKFHGDTTIQVRDVDARILEILSILATPTEAENV